MAVRPAVSGIVLRPCFGCGLLSDKVGGGGPKAVMLFGMTFDAGRPISHNLGCQHARPHDADPAPVAEGIGALRQATITNHADSHRSVAASFDIPWVRKSFTPPSCDIARATRANAKMPRVLPTPTRWDRRARQAQCGFVMGGKFPQ